MKVVILYRPNSEYARALDDFKRDFKHLYPDKQLDIVNWDSPEGTAMATLHDIMQHPAILAVRDDGSVIQTWQGQQLPLLSEVAFYAQA